METKWNEKRARVLLVAFLIILTAGRYRAWTVRTILPGDIPGNWPPPEEVRIVDATGTPADRLVVFPPGTTFGEAIESMDLIPDLSIRRKYLTRAAVLVRGNAGWTVRPMKQNERWIWGIPMDLNSVSIEDLVRIPGIGPKTAGKIFNFISKHVWLPSVDKLLAIRGVGPHRLKMLDQYLEVEGFDSNRVPSSRSKVPSQQIKLKRGIGKR